MSPRLSRRAQRLVWALELLWSRTPRRSGLAALFADPEPARRGITAAEQHQAEVAEAAAWLVVCCRDWPTTEPNAVLRQAEALVRLRRWHRRRQGVRHGR